MGQIYISNWKTGGLNCRPVKYKSHWNTARAKLNCPVIVFHWPDCNMPIIKSKGVIIDIFIVVIIIISLIRPWCCFHNQCCSKMLSLSRLFPNLALTIIRWQITREAIKFRKSHVSVIWDDFMPQAQTCNYNQSCIFHFKKLIMILSWHYQCNR